MTRKKEAWLELYLLKINTAFSQRARDRLAVETYYDRNTDMNAITY